MINLLLGRPGSGKSYEAVVYHVMIALSEGRKVITNLPLNLDYIFSVYPEYKPLILIREKSLSGSTRPFSTVADFQDDWRGVNGVGAFYVIDECHKFFPVGQTPKAIDEWFAEHRHLGVDVLLITQSYRKLSRSIVDMIQVVYRLSNNRTLGTDKSYIRKVQDGVRGTVLSTQVRTYEPANFKLYKSHTKSQSSVTESTAKDIRPLWMAWPFLGAGLFLGVGVPLLVYNLVYNNPLTKPLDTINPINLQSNASAPVSVSSPKPYQSQSSKVEDEALKVTDTPFGRVQLHIAGFIQSADKKKTLYQFAASQNGQVVFLLSHNDLVYAGYTIRSNGSCNAELSYKTYSFFVICDSPRISAAPQESFAGGKVGGPAPAVGSLPSASP